jgi:TRAP transporter T-component
MLVRAMPLGRLLCLALGLVLGLLLGGCAPQTLLLHSVADQLAAQDSASEDDLGLARDASAFYLKLSESVLARTPDHLGLAAAVAGGYTQYAYAFVAFDADRIEARDARAAKRLRERAARLYRRGQGHALRALERRHPGLALALADERGVLPRLSPDETALAYWGAAAWGGAISLSKGEPDAVADLPQVIRLAGLAWATDPDHGQGALATLMASLALARPGGSAREAAAYLDRAIAAGRDRQAGPHVVRAEALAEPAGDRGRFEHELRRALELAAAHPGLANAAMAERARWLLDTADDRF